MKMTQEKVTQILKQAVPNADFRVLHHMEGGINFNLRLKVAAYDRDNQAFRSLTLQKQLGGHYHLIDDRPMNRNLQDPFIVKGILARACPERALVYHNHTVAQVGYTGDKPNGNQLFVEVHDEVSGKDLVVELVLDDGRYKLVDEYIDATQY